jgi:hypothetical protein
MRYVEKLAILACFAIIIIALVSCATNPERRERPDTMETESPTIEPIQESLETQIASDITDSDSIIDVVDDDDVEEVKVEEEPTAILTIDEALILASHELPFEGQSDVVHLESTWENEVEIYHFEIIWFGDGDNYHHISVNSITGSVTIEELWHDWDDWFEDYIPSQEQLSIVDALIGAWTWNNDASFAIVFTNDSWGENNWYGQWWDFNWYLVSDNRIHMITHTGEGSISSYATVFVSGNTLQITPDGYDTWYYTLLTY